jgi:hypothetical protein
MISYSKFVCKLCKKIASHVVLLYFCSTNLKAGLALPHFTEGPLNFRPTYKFDHNSDEYDTSKKKRLPAWTDRILYVDRGVKPIAYDADFSLRSSDHRPVFATFVCDVDMSLPNIFEDVDENNNTNSKSNNKSGNRNSGSFGVPKGNGSGSPGQPPAMRNGIVRTNLTAPVYKSESQVCNIM